jgi:hypothetical protein
MAEGDLIGLRGAVLLDTMRALDRYAEQHGYEEWLKGWMEPQWAAWLTFLLAAEEDTPELFPHGKWATIQHIQSLIADEADSTISTRKLLK